MPRPTYLDINVLTAARQRMAWIFDRYETVQVSISGGKDSTALLHLALHEAEKRGRMIEVFFLDQEAEYAATVELILRQMTHPLVIPRWYQVPIYMTNATSYSEHFLYAWGEGQPWMRPKVPLAIHAIAEDYPQRFYQFFPYMEQKASNTAFLVGLRAQESITRYRAVTKNPGVDNVNWSTKAGGYNTCRFYPIYDWAWNDVWKFIHDYAIEYNRVYDQMFWSKYSMYKMRVSNLIHEKSYKCLVDLPKFEPETYDALCKRISGVATASRYASERLIFSNKQLPKHYANWREFRDFLLANIPDEGQKTRFAARFAKQPAGERTYKQQVGQLLLNDYENSKSIDLKANDKLEERKKQWMQML